MVFCYYKEYGEFRVALLAYVVSVSSDQLLTICTCSPESVTHLSMQWPSAADSSADKTTPSRLVFYRSTLNMLAVKWASWHASIIGLTLASSEHPEEIALMQWTLLSLSALLMYTFHIGLNVHLCFMIATWLVLVLNEPFCCCSADAEISVSSRRRWILMHHVCKCQHH